MKFISTLFAAVALCTISAAQATTIDFSNGVPDGATLNTSNFVIAGAMFSPNCHTHLATTRYAPGGFPDSVPADGGAWLGFDSAGCADLHNDDFLGPDLGHAGRMFITMADGARFSLDAVDFVRYAGSASNLYVQASSGATMTLGANEVYKNYQFDGAGWDDLDWVMFSDDYSATYVGIDNLAFTVAAVPEPDSSAAWLALAGACALGRRTRKDRGAGN